MLSDACYFSIPSNIRNLSACLCVLRGHLTHQSASPTTNSEKVTAHYASNQLSVHSVVTHQHQHHSTLEWLRGCKWRMPTLSAGWQEMVNVEKRGWMQQSVYIELLNNPDSQKSTLNLSQSEGSKKYSERVLSYCEFKPNPSAEREHYWSMHSLNPQKLRPLQWRHCPQTQLLGEQQDSGRTNSPPCWETAEIQWRKEIFKYTPWEVYIHLGSVSH